MERISGNGRMALKARLAAAARRHPRLARAAAWALLGGAAPIAGLWMAAWLGLPDAFIGGVEIGPLRFYSSVMFAGSFYSGALCAAIWRSGQAGWRQAAGFAILGMFWFNFGWHVGLELVSSLSDLPFESRLSLAYFAGILTATVWMTLAGLLLLPALRPWRHAAWLLGAGAGYATLVAVVATGGVDVFSYLTYVIAAWCAVYAAALSLALPPRPAAVKRERL